MEPNIQIAATINIACTSALMRKPLINDIIGPIILVNEVEIDVIVPLYRSGVSA
ncbi:hypothetical protein SDC49_14005 [Lactobacillus sp. R2/2]|nr:hypothetical protein [Lactobacillus sp. R2/2]